jgi:phosphatidylserine decarboxylase
MGQAWEGHLAVPHESPTAPDALVAPPSPQQHPLPVEAPDPQLTSIQPGGGVCMSLELLWGRVRRGYLRALRPRYLARMRQTRQGVRNGCPFAVLDPRDTKYFRNQGGYYWDAGDDPFRWRDRLPFARAGLGELCILGSSFGLLALGLGWLNPWLALGPLALAAGVVWFFRDPMRAVPGEPGLVVAPADGKVVSIERQEHDDFVGGPAVSIGIFLSVFNVHINRSPVAARVIGQTYRRGKFLNALRPESARENEQLATRFQETVPPFRRMIVRQITGAIARRIVCWVAPGDEVARGERFGMIKLGSRTELVIPWDDTLCLRTELGERIRAGSTILAQYVSDPRNETL